MQALTLFKIPKPAAINVVSQLTTIRLAAVSTLYAFAYLDSSQVEAIKNKFGEVLTFCEPFEIMNH